MTQNFYRVIYSPEINYLLRNINRAVYRVLPAVPRIPPSGTLRINTGNRTLKIRTNQTNYLTYLVFWEGWRNFEYTDIFMDLAGKIGTFYDIGANIGYYSLLAASANPDARIYAFEPATGPLHFLRENIALNNLTNISAEPIALSHLESGMIEFYEIGNRKYSYLEHNLAGEGNAGSRTEGRHFRINPVPTTTLDCFFLARQDQRVDLIKIDTEGTEHLILGNGRKLLETCKPLVICETLYQTIESELEAVMKGLGYRFFNHVPGGLEEVPTLVRDTDNGVRNCFFVHPDRLPLIREHILR